MWHDIICRRKHTTELCVRNSTLAPMIVTMHPGCPTPCPVPKAPGPAAIHLIEPAVHSFLGHFFGHANIRQLWSPASEIHSTASNDASPISPKNLMPIMDRKCTSETAQLSQTSTGKTRATQIDTWSNNSLQNMCLGLDVGEVSKKGPSQSHQLFGLT